MGISFDKALGMAQPALKLRAERAGLLASNLANIDTPGYKARDMNFHQLLANQKNPAPQALRSTQAKHFDHTGGPRPEYEYLYRIPQQPAIDGNTVEENIEHAEYMKNSMEFQVAFTMLNGSFNGLKKAIRGE